MEPDYYLQAVKVKREIGYITARRMASQFMSKKRRWFTETETHYYFRNISIKRFHPKSLMEKRVNDNISLIIGRLRKDIKTLITPESVQENRSTDSELSSDSDASQDSDSS
jgi:uncharacterized HAD superfamily protein